MKKGGWVVVTSTLSESTELLDLNYEPFAVTVEPNHSIPGGVERTIWFKKFLGK